MIFAWIIACFFTIVFIIPSCVLFLIRFFIRIVEFILPENLTKQ